MIDTYETQENDHHDRDSKFRHIESRPAAADRPAKAIDHRYHRVEIVEQLKLLRHDRRTEADRGDIESQLANEWDHKTKIPVFDIERCDIETGTQCSEKCQQQKKWQGQDMPVGNILIPDHQNDQDQKRDQEVYSRDDHRGCRDDQSGEVDLGDEIGISDQRVACVRECRSKKGPGQHRCKDEDGIRYPFTG